MTTAAGLFRTIVDRRRVSDAAVASLTLLAVAGLCGLVLGLDVAVGALIAGITLAGIAAGIASDRLLVTAITGGCVALAAPVVASIVLSPLSVLASAGLVGLLGLLLTITSIGAVFAAVLVGTPMPGDGRVKRASIRLVAGTGFVLVVLSVGAFFAGVSRLNPLSLAFAAFDLILIEGLVGTTRRFGLLTFAIAWALGLGAPALVLGRVPLESLVPPDRRDPIRDRLTTLRRRLLYAAAVGVVPPLALFGIVVATTGETRPGGLATAIHPIVDALVTPFVTLVAFRVLLVVSAVLSCLVAVGYRAGSWLRQQSRRVLVLTAVPGSTMLGSALVIGLLVDLAGLDDQLIAGVQPDTAAQFEPLLRAGGTLLWLAVVAASVLVVLVLLSTLVLAVRYEVLPAHAAGNALASQGIFAGSLAAGIIGSPVLAILGATAAMIVWDVGTVSRTLDRTLPAAADSTRFELVRIGGSVAIGIVAILIALVTQWLATSGTLAPRSDGLSMLLLLLGVGTTIAAVFALRG